MTTTALPTQNQSVRAPQTGGTPQRGANFLITELGSLSKAFAVNSLQLVFEPIKYLFPGCGPSLEGKSVTPLIGLASQQARQGTVEDQNAIITRLDKLKEIAGISRSIFYQTSDDSKMKTSSFGGRFSLTSPTVTMPINLLRRQAFVEGNLTTISYGSTKGAYTLQDKVRSFTDKELDFFALREFGKVKQNHHLYKAIFKTMIIGLFFLSGIFSLPFLPVFVPLAGLALYQKAILITVMVGFYNLVVTKRYSKKADDFAVLYLAETLRQEDRNRHTSHYYVSKARRVATNALDKIRKANIQDRLENWTNNIFVTKSGNDYREVSQARLTTRQNRLKTIHYERIFKRLLEKEASRQPRQILSQKAS
jgi:hypothetical protein